MSSTSLQYISGIYSEGDATETPAKTGSSYIDHIDGHVLVYNCNSEKAKELIQKNMKK